MASSLSARLARAGRKDVSSHNFNSTSALVSKLKHEGRLEKVEAIMHTVEQVSTLLASGVDGQHYSETILNMCYHVKVYGAYLESIYKDQLDKAFVVFRNISLDLDKLDYTSKLHLLELIELRANQWKGTEAVSNYYKKKLNQEADITSDVAMNSSMESSAMMSPISPPLLGPGEIMKSSGKFPKPTRIPGKNYSKDEVVIRNADSGKVMGIKGRRVHMIEELSETIISFQRVNPGAKERLVQITGANESSISHAKQLIEDTIRRNASPIRDANSVLLNADSNSSLNSSASDDSAPTMMTRGNLLHSLSTNDASVGEYKYTVIVNGTETIRITGKDLDLVRISKIVLDDYFQNNAGRFYSADSIPRSPLSPHETNECGSPNVFSNGQHEEPATPVAEVDYSKPLRSPFSFMKTEDVNEVKAEPEPAVSSAPELKFPEKFRRYTNEGLVRMSMSPSAIATPDDWDRISLEHPYIVRKAVEIFDADQYLSNRATMVHALCTSASDDSILSGSSV